MNAVQKSGIVENIENNPCQPCPRGRLWRLSLVKLTNLKNMNTITAQQIVLTPTGPVALIDGVWYSVNGTSTEVHEIRYALPAPPALAPIRLGQMVFWVNMFGITNSGRVEFADELHVIVRLPDDEDTGTRGGTLTLRRSQVSTSR